MVLLEDVAALTGLVLALLGVGLTALTDDTVWDGLGTVAIGVLLVAVAVVLVIETKSLLLGEVGAPGRGAAPSPTATRRRRRVDRVIHLRTMHLGPEELLVGGQGGHAARRRHWPRWPPPSTPPRPGCGPPCRRRGSSTSSRTSTAAEPSVPAPRPARAERRSGGSTRPTNLGRCRLLFALDGIVRDYAWGSTTAIQELLGRPVDGRPAAELWLGAHPDDPSFAPEHGPPWTG